jgi:hypothetical protein
MTFGTAAPPSTLVRLSGALVIRTGACQDYAVAPLASAGTPRGAWRSRNNHPKRDPRFEKERTR